MRSEAPAADDTGKVPKRRWLIPPRSTISFAFLLLVFVASALTAIFQQVPADIHHVGAGQAVDHPGPDWLAPLELNADARAGISTDLHGLYVMPDGRRLWAVGAARTIWHSDDGGRRWVLQYPRARDADTGSTTAFVDWLPLPSAQAFDARKEPARPASGPDYLSKGQDPTQTAPAPGAGVTAQVANPAVQTAVPAARPVDEKNPKASRPTTRPQPASAPASAASSAASVPAGVPAGAASRVSTQAAVPSLPDPGPDDSLVSIQFDATGNTGWAVGSAGTILATADGGQTWRPQRVGDGLRTNLRSVAFLTPDDVWIVGDDGLVLRSRNRGRHWETVPSGAGRFVSAFAGRPTGANPWGVWFVGTSLTIAAPQLDENLGLAGWRLEDMGNEVATTQANLTRALASMRDAVASKPGKRAGVDYPIVADQLALVNLGRAPGDTADSAVFLQSLVLGDSGDPAWAAGGSGLLLKRASTGWVRARIEPMPDVRAIAPSRTRLWAAGEGGLFSIDTASPGDYDLADDLRLYDGRQWVRETSPTAPTVAIAGLRAMQFVDDHRGWAVGKQGAVVATDDGEHWHWMSPAGSQAVGSYHAYPSPMALMGMGVSLGWLLWLARRARLGAVREPAGPTRYETGLDSDQPLRDVKNDKLGHATTVKALSAFIRNIDTAPRLTIAITAPWGQGKSSVMRMLQSDLEGFGYRTAWFNAWHHQQEGRPLTALFGAIGAQALPHRLVPNLWLRFRLIWKRGLAYRLLVVASIAVAAIVVADATNGVRKMREDGMSALDALEWRTAAVLLDRPRVVLTEHSLQALNPCGAAAKGASAPAAASCVPCPPNALAEQGAATTGLRAKAWCYAKNRLVWQSANGDYNGCEDARSGGSRRCVFRSPEDLVSAIENGIESDLSPNERKLVVAAGETLPPPPLLPFTEKILPGVAIVLGLLLTKGISVYGLELLKPLRLLLSPESRAGGEGKEASGVIEKYRTQFGNLASALRGRLVIFIDDLDRCSKETVNSVLEMSNYLTDVGECFLVIGADLEIIKLSLKAPDDESATPANAAASRDAYASRYLRKLIHVEVPVPATTEALARTLIGVSEAQRDKPPGLRLPSAFDALRGQLPRALWTVLTLAAVYVAVGSVMRYRDSELQTVGVRAPDLSASSNPALPASSPSATLSTVVTSLTPAATAPVSTAPATSAIASAQRAQRGSPLLAGVLWFVVCAAALGSVWLLRPGQAVRRLQLLRARLVLATGGSLQTHDPKDMQEALDLWHEIVYLADGTPRGSRRYRNKSRLFGMLLTMQFKNHEELRANVHAAALVALNFVSPGALAALTMRAGLFGPAGGKPVASLVDDALVNGQLMKHEARFGAIPLELVIAFQAWSATIQVR